MSNNLTSGTFKNFSLHPLISGGHLNFVQNLTQIWGYMRPYLPGDRIATIPVDGPSSPWLIEIRTVKFWRPVNPPEFFGAGAPLEKKFEKNISTPPTVGDMMLGLES